MKERGREGGSPNLKHKEVIDYRGDRLDCSSRCRWLIPILHALLQYRLLANRGRRVTPPPHRHTPCIEPFFCATFLFAGFGGYVQNMNISLPVVPSIVPPPSHLICTHLLCAEKAKSSYVTLWLRSHMSLSGMPPVALLSTSELPNVTLAISRGKALAWRGLWPAGAFHLETAATRGIGKLQASLRYRPYPRDGCGFFG